MDTEIDTEWFEMDTEIVTDMDIEQFEMDTEMGTCQGKPCAQSTFDQLAAAGLCVHMTKVIFKDRQDSP